MLVVSGVDLEKCSSIPIKRKTQEYWLCLYLVFLSSHNLFYSFFLQRQCLRKYILQTWEVNALAPSLLVTSHSELCAWCRTLPDCSVTGCQPGWWGDPKPFWKASKWNTVGDLRHDGCWATGTCWLSALNLLFPVLPCKARAGTLYILFLFRNKKLEI